MIDQDDFATACEEKEELKVWQALVGLAFLVAFAMVAFWI